MKDIIKRRVYYGDTDAYGVVWHGAYLRWMEAGRVEFCDKIGLDLVKLMKKDDITIPVTNLNVRYKGSAKLDETVLVETSVTKVTPLTIVFSQTIRNEKDLKLYIQAEVEVVAVNREGKLYRRMPEVLKSACMRSMECKD